jgi:hypothetical protein
LRIAWNLGLYTPKKIETFLDIDHKYMNPLKTMFSKIFQSEINYNGKIDPIFYDKKAYNEYMQESNTELERIWRTRIVLENTPRGNVLMFYDAFKMGFSFYSDEKNISYDILNAVAMKYVSLYRCRDFFMDEAHVPKEKVSPFIKLYFTEDTKKPVPSTGTNPFAKMRKENPNAKIHQQKQPEEKEPEKMKNKFLYLGKMGNALFIQPGPKKRKVLAKFTSPLLETIKMESGVQRETMSYKDFKNSKLKSTEKSSSS